MESTSLPAGFSLRANTLPAFATPIIRYKWPQSEALNARLRDIILEVEKNDPGVRKSNVGGWHSGPELFFWPQPEIKTLVGRVRTLVAETMKASGVRRSDTPRKYSVSMEAWANVLRSGHYNAVHAHPNFMWSGVYYVAVAEMDSEEPPRGMIEFLDPRDAVNHLNLSELKFSLPLLIKPQSGLMLIFPAWLRHFVHPFTGTGARISVAFNAVARDREATPPDKRT